MFSVSKVQSWIGWQFDTTIIAFNCDSTKKRFGLISSRMLFYCKAGTFEVNNLKNAFENAQATGKDSHKINFRIERERKFDNFSLIPKWHNTPW